MEGTYVILEVEKAALVRLIGGMYGKLISAGDACFTLDGTEIFKRYGWPKLAEVALVQMGQ